MAAGHLATMTLLACHMYVSDELEVPPHHELAQVHKQYNNRRQAGRIAECQMADTFCTMVGTNERSS